MNVVNSALSSRRFNRWLLVVGAVVFVAGVAAVLVTFLGNTAKTENTAPTGPAVVLPKPQKDIPFPPAAWNVAKQFLFTAVARKNLAASYAITSPDVRAGYTKKQWETGSLPFPPYPVAKVQKFNWKNTNYAHPRDAQINVILLPTKGSNQRPLYAQVGLSKVGTGAGAHWIVNYFGPLGGPPVPTPK